ncbi:glycerol-3-phosphate phosphatase [Daphnia magna]|uniref:Phospholysine phosphohistidine inorganic pyrophosphate phosphatase n=2 Tax=Daphnia magna TaxID=35525 RepID=A0A0P5YSV3_9CRUS|nr:glycerol-3-phosphate phosphatase [Daphnia magna]KAK4011231.1 hypothetical protein OUZ56_020344 [Daphnia magna]KZS09280.1 Phospholysine phosphohistidine inorganic pyrophosphate phosphatase [Daphnia magna]
MAAVKLSKDIARVFVNSFDTVLFDCDGVLWAGSKVLYRAVETVNYLKDSGKQIFYVTNNSTKTRAQYLEKLMKLGFNADEKEIATSGYLVASYLESINFQQTVYLIGSKGFAEELRNHGIKHTQIGPDTMATDMPTYVNGQIELESEIGAVVIGFDEHLSYPKILKAANYLANPNCLFLASNADETFPMEIPLVVPGTGVMVKAVETASQRTAKVFGKPSVAMFEAISKQCKINPQRTLMIGDRCNTDISFGKNCQLTTLLVLSGVTSLKHLEQYKHDEQHILMPDFYTDVLGDILDLLEQ